MTMIDPLDPLRRDAERISRLVRGNPGNELEVERYHGQIVQVGDFPVRVVVLPDWGLEYIEYPKGEMPKYRDALMRQRVKIRKVTSQRIYFET